MIIRFVKFCGMAMSKPWFNKTNKKVLYKKCQFVLGYNI